MFENEVGRIGLHASKPISKGHFGSWIKLVALWIHFSVLLANQFCYLHYCMELYGQILGVLVINIIVGIVNRFLAELKRPIGFRLAAGALGMRINLQILRATFLETATAANSSGGTSVLR